MRQELRVVVRGFVVSVVLAGAALFGGRAETSAQPPGILELPAFNSIHVPNGGHIVIRRASTQRVTVAKGSQEFTRLRVTDGVLVIEIDRHNRRRDRGDDVVIEVPSVARLSLSNGGWIRSLGSFPRQAEIDVEVRNGGTIDTRSMPVDRVTAAVEQGGRILTLPGVTLFATVSHGGVIVYWGNPRVMRSVQDGGVVEKGEADQLNASLLNDDQFAGHRGSSIWH